MVKNRLLARMGSSFSARLVMAAVNFGLFWALSHRFDMASLGSYSLLMNLFFMTLGLPLLGLAVPLERRAAATPETLSSEMSNALVIALPVGGLLMIALGLYGHWGHEAALRGPFWLLGLAVWVSAGILVAESALYGREEMGYIARMQCAEAVLRTVCALAAVVAGAGLMGVMAVFLGLRVAIAAAYFLSPRLPRLSLAGVDGSVFRRNLGEMPVFFGIAMLAGIVSRLDLLVLDRLDGKAQVAVYTVSARLYEASLMLPTVVAIVLLPALCRLFASDERRFTVSLVVMLQGVWWIGLPIALGVAALAQPLIDLLYPASYAAAADILRWLMLAALMTALDQVLSSAMLASQSQVDDLHSMLVSMGALCLGFVALVPALGPLGVSIAVAVALAARVAFRLRWAYRRFQPAGLTRLLVKGLACAAAGVVGLVAGLPRSPWLALLLAGAGVLLAAALSGQLSRHPLRDLGRWRERWVAGGLN